ncbi:toxin-antitoxin system HicB family antitoxin [Sandaracinobacter sp. RS1-74]|uniref:toxin-antitoxin system HicB family antitoxin n=1 Tax=Sandaracinobacteroides sayramensis TaxID=2913411 RepID=UPI001EDB0358|nr:toxin-antitoxin system HicB family antitoxin [Sandaracinobacteroides sayramensis]MCG2841415.1 toxin-antitoxin system HicB family antitoxin [Sandaracinobacteroides sayramensis]
MADQRKSLLLRLDPALHAAVERLAAAELRSTNAEIELLLREGLARRGVTLARIAPAKRGRPSKSREPG